MCKTLILITALFLSFTVSASEMCDAWGELGASAVVTSQEGVPISRALALDVEGDPLFKKVVTHAYDLPKFDTKEQRGALAAEYKALVILACEISENK